MRPPVTDPLLPRCGNCKFWDRLDNQPANIKDPNHELGACGGLPFQVLLIGMKPSRFNPNQGEMMTEMVRPNVAAALYPCALYMPTPQVILGQAKGPVSKLDS